MTEVGENVRLFGYDVFFGNSKYGYRENVASPPALGSIGLRKFLFARYGSGYIRHL